MRPHTESTWQTEGRHKTQPRRWCGARRRFGFASVGGLADARPAVTIASRKASVAKAVQAPGVPSPNSRASSQKRRIPPARRSLRAVQLRYTGQLAAIPQDFAKLLSPKYFQLHRATRGFGTLPSTHTVPAKLIILWSLVQVQHGLPSIHAGFRAISSPRCTPKNAERYQFGTVVSSPWRPPR